jgi:homoserine kinase
MRFTVRVPATAANLGPGFDCFGMALDLCNEVAVDTEAEPGVTWEGEGADELPTDGSDMLSRAIRFAQGSAADGLALPPFHLHGRNLIPLQRGLGSSSAAAVAGIAAACRLLDVEGLRDRRTWFDLAREIEGHPDNAAAAVFGGFTIVGGERHRRLDPHPSLRPVVLIPRDARLPTAEARAALPSSVPFDDAVHQIGATALSVVAFTQEPALLPDALDDWLHQSVRLALVPAARALFDELRAASVPVCVSGAGPTLLAFETEGHEVEDPGEGWQLIRVAPRRIGVEILEG